MKLKLKHTLTLAALSTLYSAASAQELTNADFSSGVDPWIAGSNLFVGGAWQAFVGSAGGDYAVTDVTAVSGSQVTFSSRDDGASDSIENYLYQEFGAGPSGSDTPTVYQTGDVITFSGRAMATKTGADTSDVITRAFIKTLGYNELQWAFQVKDEYTQYFDLTDQMQDFQLSITYPDLAVDDSLQVIQYGFEVTTTFDSGANAMDAGTIVFENIAGGVGGGTEPEKWLGYDVVQGDVKAVDTGSWLGWVAVDAAPFIYSYSLSNWLYIDENLASEGGAWVYVFR